MTKKSALYSWHYDKHYDKPYLYNVADVFSSYIRIIWRNINTLELEVCGIPIVVSNEPLIRETIGNCGE